MRFSEVGPNGSEAASNASTIAPNTSEAAQIPGCFNQAQRPLRQHVEERDEAEEGGLLLGPHGGACQQPETQGGAKRERTFYRGKTGHRERREGQRRELQHHVLGQLLGERHREKDDDRAERHGRQPVGAHDQPIQRRGARGHAQGDGQPRRKHAHAERGERQALEDGEQRRVIREGDRGPVAVVDPGVANRVQPRPIAQPVVDQRAVHGVPRGVGPHQAALGRAAQRQQPEQQAEPRRDRHLEHDRGEPANGAVRPRPADRAGWIVHKDVRNVGTERRRDGRRRR